MQPKPIAAIDGDGVLFDYDTRYIDAWEKAFNWRPTLVNPAAYTVTAKYGVPELEGEELAHLRSFIDGDFFRYMSFYDGVEEAVRILAEHYDLVCVTALSHDMRSAREDALRHLPFKGVVSTPVPKGWCRHTGTSPKAEAIRDIGATLFVDDYLPFHRNVGAGVHQVLLSHPNETHTALDLKHIDAVHENFVEFVSSHTRHVI